MATDEVNGALQNEAQNTLINNNDNNAQFGERVKKHGSINRYLDNYNRTRFKLMFWDLIRLVLIAFLIGLLHKNLTGDTFFNSIGKAYTKTSFTSKTETEIAVEGGYVVWEGVKNFSEEFIKAYAGNKTLIDLLPNYWKDLKTLLLIPQQFILNNFADNFNKAIEATGIIDYISLSFYPIDKEKNLLKDVDFKPFDSVFNFVNLVFWFLILSYVLTIYQLYAQKRLINASLNYLYVPKWALWTFFNRNKKAYMYCKLLDFQLNKAVNSQGSEMAVSNIFDLGENFINDKIEFKEIPKHFLKMYDYKKVVYIQNDQTVAHEIERQKQEKKEKAKAKKEKAKIEKSKPKKTTSNNSNNERLDDLEEKVEEVEEVVEEIKEANKLDLDALDNFEE